MDRPIHFFINNIKVIQTIKPHKTSALGILSEINKQLPAQIILPSRSKSNSETNSNK